MQEPGAASASGPEGAITLASLVWLQHGPKGMFAGQDPGLLIAREGGRISLVTLKEKVFEAEKHEIGVKWPWWEFGQGAHLKVAGKTYRFGWIPGSGTSAAWGRREIERVVSTLAEREGFTGALAKGKAWKSYLKT